MGLEHPLEMALVGKPEPIGHLRQCLPFTQQLPPTVDPGIEQVGMRCKPGGRAKCANQLVAPKPGLPRQCGQRVVRGFVHVDTGTERVWIDQRKAKPAAPTG